MSETKEKTFQEMVNEDIERGNVSGQKVADENSDAPKPKPVKFSAEMIKRDKRKTDIVEINLKDASARVVKSSKAPKLTKKSLKEKGAPVQCGETFIDGVSVEVDMYHGTPFGLEIARQSVLDRYKDNFLKDLEVFAERERAVKRLMMAHMIPDTFSYDGKPEGLPPIEDISDVLLGGLWEAYLNLHFPVKDDIYQVKVLRGVPADVQAMLGDSYEMYPVGSAIRTDDMEDDEIENFVKRSDAQRSVIVSSMILDPCLSYEGEGKSKHPTPVENLSDWIMQCLMNAYRASNVPKGGQELLSRFLLQRARSINTNGKSNSSGD